MHWSCWNYVGEGVRVAQRRFQFRSGMLRLMRKRALPSLILVSIFAAGAQDVVKMRKKVPGSSKPECAQGAICFSGEVREGQTFRKDLGAGLEFLIGLPGGFQVGIVRADADCKKLNWVADPPFRAHHQTEIDAEMIGQPSRKWRTPHANSALPQTARRIAPYLIFKERTLKSSLRISRRWQMEKGAFGSPTQE